MNKITKNFEFVEFPFDSLKIIFHKSIIPNSTQFSKTGTIHAEQFVQNTWKDRKALKNV